MGSLLFMQINNKFGTNSQQLAWNSNSVVYTIMEKVADEMKRLAG